MTSNWLAALPVYNEAKTVTSVLNQVFEYADNVLAVNDGSTDGTDEQLKKLPKLRVVHHEKNRGYGAALVSAFNYAIEHDFEYIVTLDCDGQHQPKRIPRFVHACKNADIVSGSRYLKKYPGDSQPPAQRLFINRQITRQINQRLGLCLTDAFCGLRLTEYQRSNHSTSLTTAMPCRSRSGCKQPCWACVSSKYLYH